MERTKELAEKLHKHKLLMLELENLDCETNKENARTHILQKKKYTYIDIGNGKYNSGKWMVDLLGNVWSIKAYGQRKGIIGTTEQVLNLLNVDIQAIQEALIRKKETGNFGMIALNL